MGKKIKKTNTNKRWVLMNSMFDELGLVRQHLDSFNDFIEKGLQSVISEIKAIEPEDSEFYVELEKIEVEEPTVREADGSQSPIYPMEARIRNLTYASRLFLHMKPIHKDPLTGLETPRESTSVFIGYLPIMLKSKKCALYNLPDESLIKLGEDPRDPGGYFIINGSERVIVTQEDLAPNRILIEKLTSKGNVTSEGKVFSVIHGFRAPVSVEHTSDGQLRVSFPSMPRKISLILLMRALGIERDDMIAMVISPTPKLRSRVMSILMRESSEIVSTEESLDYIGKRVAVGQTKEYRINRAMQVLDKYLLPHLGNDEESRLKKAFFLARMAQRLLELESGVRTEDDKDHYANKRLKLAGDLLLMLYRVAFHALCRDIKYQLERVTVRGRKPNLKTAVRADLITERLRHALATGNWTGGKSGVSQLLDRTNYISALSHLRRVVSPLSRSQPHFEARDLHPTHFGKICPNETPEGPNCVLPNTLVTITGGSNRTIGSFLYNDDWNKQQVVSVNWNPDGSGDKNMKKCNVARFIRNPIKENTKIYRIKTKMDREVYATADHPFYYESNGQKCRIDAKDLRTGHKVAVLPASTQRPDWSSVFLNHYDDVLIDEDTFVQNLPPKSRTWKAALSKAKDLGLIPLKYNNPMLPILTRLVGFVVGDGHLGLRERIGASGKTKYSVVVVFSGKPDELEEINNDLKHLGFEASDVIAKEITSELEDGQIIKGTSYQIRLDDRILWTILRSLGGVIGDKATNIPSIPQWIMESIHNTNKYPIIREYLAGLFGSEMSTPSVDKRDGKTFLSPMFSLNIINTEENRMKAEDYLDQIIDLCKVFEVETAPKAVVIRKGTKRKSGDKTIKLRLIFSSEIHNLVKLYSKIGFAYEQNRERLAQYTVGYLNEKIRKRNFRQRAAEITWENRDKPFDDIWAVLFEELPRIAVENPLVTKHDILNWARKDSLDADSIRIQAKNFPTFEEWINNNCVKTDSNIGLIWEEVVETERVVLHKEGINFDFVDDFTINDDSHNFFANGFLTGNCGLVKNLALQAYISVGIDSQEIERKLIDDLGLSRIAPKDIAVPSSEVAKLITNPNYYKIFINGSFLGVTKDGIEFRRKITDERRKGNFHHEVNVAFYEDTKELMVNCDAGRVRRPLLIVENGSPRLTKEMYSWIKSGKWEWSDLLRNQVVEYVDAEEEENLYIAISEDDLNPDISHMEIAPSTILGICASLIPYPEHNRSDRNVYEAGMAKQALGLFSANYMHRLDTRAHILHYPQKPLVKTHGMDAIHFQQRPAGQNFVVALLSYEGYNMEDAILINKAAIERGLGRSTFFRTYDAEERKYPNGQEDTFEIPDETVRGYKDESAYVHLGEDGIIEPEIGVDGTKGEVLIGRTSPPRFLEEYTEFDVPPQNRRETSKAMRHGEKGISDLVVLTDTNEGNRLVKVKVRSERIPEIGDKFASRHGQKGVIGLIIPQEDMPFTESGIVPDIIVNPHAVPSRMTVGHLMELLGGKVASQKGEAIYGTAFSNTPLDELHNALKESNVHPYGREVMYDGKTGNKLEGTIFVGCQFYQKLHHLVSDKIHARARGPIQMLTRQPTEGRAREGGLRFGEMERDCLIGHGTSILLKERLLDESDKTEGLICSKCGFLAMYDKNRDKYHCPICKEETTVSKVIISYAFKLLLQELMSLGIAPHVELEDIA